MDRTQRLATIRRLKPAPVSPRFIGRQTTPPAVSCMAYLAATEAHRIERALGAAFCTPEGVGQAMAAADRLLSLAADLKAALQRIGE